MKASFFLMVLCFAAWGTAANMTDPLVKVFSHVFNMSMLQAALVQFSYYGAYFCLAIPAAWINWRFGYKCGVLTGLGCAIAGALLFYPASCLMTFNAFLMALFVLAGGLSILETSANPYVMSMGPAGNATRRLNLAQAFNPVGTNLGVLLAATLILPGLHGSDAAAREAMSAAALIEIQQAELLAVMTPYVGMALVLLLIWISLALLPAPAPDNRQPSGISAIPDMQGVLARLWHNPHYRLGVVAQFFNVAAQTCVWTFTIPYVVTILGVKETEAAVYLQASMLVFLVSRFVMTAAMGYVRPALLLTALASLGIFLSCWVALIPGYAAVLALVMLSACLSLMFPTIYGIALRGLGDDTKFGAAGLVMAILGGALLPLLQAAVTDYRGIVVSFLVPAGCFMVVAAYGVFDLQKGFAAGR